MKMYLYIVCFWFLMVFVVIYLLFFNNHDNVSYQNFKWDCSDDLCRVSFYVVNEEGLDISLSYSLLFMNIKEASAYSFRNFGIGKTYLKEVFLKKTDDLYLQPYQTKRVSIEVPVDSRPSDVGIVLKLQD